MRLLKLKFWKNGHCVEIRDNAGNLSRYTYDYAGNMTKSTDGAGNTTEYEYNGADQMTALTDPEGG